MTQPAEWRPEVVSEDFLVSSDLLKALTGMYVGENRPALSEREARHIASTMWNRVSAYATYRYALGFRHGCDYQKRELEHEVLAAAEEAPDAPEQLDLLGGAA